MKGNFLLLAIVVVVIAGVSIMVWTFSRSRQMLDSWAAESSYQLLSSEIRWIRRGPFFWTTSESQVVYYVTVRAHDGTAKSGWVRCGSFLFGVLQDKVEARWEEN
jgi:hypothetical protein